MIRVSTKSSNEAAGEVKDDFYSVTSAAKSIGLMTFSQLFDFLVTNRKDGELALETINRYAKSKRGTADAPLVRDLRKEILDNAGFFDVVDEYRGARYFVGAPETKGMLPRLYDYDEHEVEEFVPRPGRSPSFQPIIYVLSGEILNVIVGCELHVQKTTGTYVGNSQYIRIWPTGRVEAVGLGINEDGRVLKVSQDIGLKGTIPDYVLSLLLTRYSRKTGKDFVTPFLQTRQLRYSQCAAKEYIVHQPVKKPELKDVADLLSFNEPDCYGAPLPPFKETAINRSEYSEGLRFKSVDVDVTDGAIVIDWESQEEDRDDGTLRAEIKRALTACAKEVGYTEQFNVELKFYCRDYGPTSGKTYRFTVN